MRGRKPRSITLARGDLPRLQRIARQVSLPYFQVQRARIVLAMADGEALQQVAARWECDPATVWRLCRRYEGAGLAALLADPHRSGRPERISPPSTDPDHSVGLPGAGRQGAAHYPLVQRRTGPPGGARRHYRRHQSAQCSAHLARGRSPTASHPLLEDRAAEREVPAASRKDLVVLYLCRPSGPAWVLGGVCRRVAQLSDAGAGANPPRNPGFDRAARVRVPTSDFLPPLNSNTAKKNR